jgi:hypothetical protein
MRRNPFSSAVAAGWIVGLSRVTVDASSRPRSAVRPQFRRKSEGASHPVAAGRSVRSSFCLFSAREPEELGR